MADASLDAMLYVVSTVLLVPTFRASPSGTFLQTLPDLVTPLKGHSLERVSTRVVVVVVAAQPDCLSTLRQATDVSDSVPVRQADVCDIRFVRRRTCLILCP